MNKRLRKKLIRNKIAKLIDVSNKGDYFIFEYDIDKIPVEMIEHTYQRIDRELDGKVIFIPKGITTKSFVCKEELIRVLQYGIDKLGEL